MRIKSMKLPTAAQVIQKKGLGQNGRVQMFHTMNVNRRIGEYMPHLGGALETKLKRIRSNTEIEVLGPYAKYQYYGKVMVGPPPKVVTDKPLEYTKDFNPKAGPFWDRALIAKDFNPKAGPFWDRALIAAEGKAMAADLQRYINRRG